MNDRPARPDQRWATFAIILIVIGAVFLLGELFNLRIGGGVWPLFLLVPGVVLLFVGFNRPTVNVGAATPGGVLTTLGLIFFYQQASNHWESWAYIWALIPLSVGLVLYLAGNRNGDGESVTNGLRMMRIFGTIFVAGLVFFELLIFDRGGLGGYLLPIALIVVGAGILVYYYRAHGTLPFGDFGGTGGSSRSPAPPAPTSPASPSTSTPRPARPAPSRSDPPAAAAPPPPASAAPPTPASRSETPAAEHFPEGEPPHEPAPDGGPFPADEEAPVTPSASESTEGTASGSASASHGKTDTKASSTAAKPRRRRTTSSTRKTTSPTKNETNEGS